MGKRLFLAAILMGCIMGMEAKSLKKAYRKYFDIGVAVNLRNVTDEMQGALVCKEFNSVTAENAMKPASTHPREGVYTWEGADRIANFCRKNKIKMRGHCLVWHNQFCDWMFTDNEGNPVSKEVFYERMREHIHTVVNRYKDVVYCWDVVNEAIADGGPNPYRNSRLYKLCGEEFIAKAFQFAREADPKALLFYNDYNAIIPHKRDNIYNMVKKMKEAGVPIDGIGMQGHYNVHWDNLKEVDEAIRKYAELVDVIHITELDMRANTDMGGNLDFKKKAEMQITDEIKQKQEERYVGLFRILREHKKVVKSVTFWNLSDKDSWLGTHNYPLLFDKEYQPKEAYYKVKDF